VLEVTSIQGGETLKWTSDYPSYPASEGWSAKAYFIGLALKTIDGTANGSAFDFTLTATDSAALDSSTDQIYRYDVRVTKSDEVHTAEEGTIVIRPDPTGLLAGTDTRSHARTTLADIETAIRTWAGNPYEYVSIAGRTQKMTINDLERLRGHYRNEVQRETNAEMIAKGLRPKNTNKLLIQF
jgi:hypothetical protein